MDIYNAINQILIEWDPIGVSKHTNINDEYSRYIPEIIEVMDDKAKLKELIYNIEGVKIGFFYTSDEEKKRVIDKIYSLKEK
jgi:hypothetical protein